MTYYAGDNQRYYDQIVRLVGHRDDASVALDNDFDYFTMDQTTCLQSFITAREYVLSIPSIGVRVPGRTMSQIVTRMHEMVRSKEIQVSDQMCMAYVNRSLTRDWRFPALDTWNYEPAGRIW